jgi:hypothetical protein
MFVIFAHVLADWNIITEDVGYNVLVMGFVQEPQAVDIIVQLVYTHHLMYTVNTL